MKKIANIYKNVKFYIFELFNKSLEYNFCFIAIFNSLFDILRN